MSENMSLTEEQVREVTQIAELAVRRYFDHYLQNVLPAQLQATALTHDLSPKAHGGVEQKFNRLMWVLIGLSASGGAGLTLLAKQVLGLP